MKRIFTFTLLLSLASLPALSCDNYDRGYYEGVIAQQRFEIEVAEDDATSYREDAYWRSQREREEASD